MPKASTIRARVETELKHNVERLFAQLGLTTTEAITLFYKQVELCQGLPFAVELPNKTTVRTFKDTDQGKGIVRCEDADDMFCQLGI
jgi:DNA-damage-inducible protein J